MEDPSSGDDDDGSATMNKHEAGLKTTRDRDISDEDF